MAAARCHPVLVCCGILVAVVLCTGCITFSIGNAGYAADNITVMISNDGVPSEAHIQVTVYEIRDLLQQVHTVLGTDVMLGEGENIVSVPGHLGPGQYKLYIYISRNGERQTAAIRDIVVN
jgi:hypothetical protein